MAITTLDFDCNNLIIFFFKNEAWEEENKLTIVNFYNNGPAGFEKKNHQFPFLKQFPRASPWAWLTTFPRRYHFFVFAFIYFFPSLLILVSSLWKRKPWLPAIGVSLSTNFLLLLARNLSTNSLFFIKNRETQYMHVLHKTKEIAWWCLFLTVLHTSLSFRLIRIYIYIDQQTGKKTCTSPNEINRLCFGQFFSYFFIGKHDLLMIIHPLVFFSSRTEVIYAFVFCFLFCRIGFGSQSESIIVGQSYESQRR